MRNSEKLKRILEHCTIELSVVGKKFEAIVTDNNTKDSYLVTAQSFTQLINECLKNNKHLRETYSAYPTWQ